VINDFLNPIVQRVLEDKARMQKAGILVDVKDKTFLQHLADHTNGMSLSPMPIHVLIFYFLYLNFYLFI
jgi:hypothetical protein